MTTMTLIVKRWSICWVCMLMWVLSSFWIWMVEMLFETGRIANFKVWLFLPKKKNLKLFYWYLGIWLNRYTWKCLYTFGGWDNDLRYENVFGPSWNERRYVYFDQKGDYYHSNQFIHYYTNIYLYFWGTRHKALDSRGYIPALVS